MRRVRRIHHRSPRWSAGHRSRAPVSVIRYPPFRRGSRLEALSGSREKSARVQTQAVTEDFARSRGTQTRSFAPCTGKDSEARVGFRPSPNDPVRLGKLLLEELARSRPSNTSQTRADFCLTQRVACTHACTHSKLIGGHMSPDGSTRKAVGMAERPGFVQVGAA